MRKILVAAALAAACAAASAQGYAGAVAGLAKYNTDCVAGVSCDDSDTGYKFFGGYQLSPGVSIEVGYTDFGQAQGSAGGLRETLKAKAYSLVGAFRSSFSPEWTGVARLGLANVKGERSTNFGVSESDSSIKLYAGVGAEYSMNDSFKLTASFDLTSADVGDDSGAVYLMGVGVQAGF